MYTLEKATDNDIPLCYRIVDDGRKFQQAQGFVQWTAEYPNIDTVSEDIMAQKGYVIKKGSKIAAYMCIDFSGEPAYDSIEGHWHTDSKYAVIHRLSVKSDFRNSGLSDIIFRLAEEFCLKNDITCIRLDTGFECSISLKNMGLHIAAQYFSKEAAEWHMTSCYLMGRMGNEFIEHNNRKNAKLSEISFAFFISGFFHHHICFEQIAVYRYFKHTVHQLNKILCYCKTKSAAFCVS